MTDERDPRAGPLREPFDPKDIKFKPQMVKNNRALAMPYIDARLIQDRLDEVMGVADWQDRYSFLPDGSVVCRLSLFLGGRWVTKTDVGSPSEQPDSGDRVKAAVSDALKRAAVKFGIGRYLYRLPAQWCDYDPVKKQLTQLPHLPAWALPGGANGRPQPSAPRPQQAPQPTQQAATPATPPASQSHTAEQFGRMIDAAETLDQLRGVMAAVNTEAKAGRLTPAQIDQLGKRKDARKVALTPAPAPQTQPPVDPAAERADYTDMLAEELDIRGVSFEWLARRHGPEFGWDGRRTPYPASPSGLPTAVLKRLCELAAAEPQEGGGS